MSAASAPTSDYQASISQRHAKRRGLITYCRIAWLDYLCIAVIAGLTLGVYFTPVYYFEHRVVPMWPPVMTSNTSQGFPEVRLPSELSYPWVTEPLPTWGCALVVVFVPLLIITIFQFKTWSLWDFHAGVVGVLKAVVSAYANAFFCASSSVGRIS
jgi:diacylglycerol diphosphate phosphatase/phosphatidate phosphatase